MTEVRVVGVGAGECVYAQTVTEPERGITAAAGCTTRRSAALCAGECQNDSARARARAQTLCSRRAPLALTRALCERVRRGPIPRPAGALALLISR